jgi:hypothetical protein
LDSLSQDIDFGNNVKESKFTPESYGRIILPADLIDVIGVFGIVAGERKTFALNTELTTIQKMDGSTLLPWLESDTTLPEYNSDGTSALLEQVAPYEYPTVFYPSGEVDYEYNTDFASNMLVLGPRVNLTEVYVRYLTNAVSASAANIVHPYAVDAISAYIDWKVSESERRAQSESMRKESNFYNQKRLLKGRMNSLVISEFYRILTTG